MIYLSKGGGGGADSDHTWIRPWVKAFWKWLENIIKKLKADYATFNIDSAVMVLT